jgi:hypothetical protein
MVRRGAWVRPVHEGLGPLKKLGLDEGMTIPKPPLRQLAAGLLTGLKSSREHSARSQKAYSITS